jgi:hypothetical protein
LAVHLEDSTRTIGPLVVGDKEFTVILQIRYIVGPSPVVDQDFRETTVGLQIQDTSGTAHYRISFPYEFNGETFVETTHAWAGSLQGETGSGILLSYNVVPSSPNSGTSWQVFGTFNGKLVPLSKPISAEGELLEGSSASGAVKTSTEPNRPGDMLHVRIWTGNFFVIVPVQLDWMQAVARPAWRCARMTARGWRPLCRFPVEAERVPSENEMTFVRLHSQPEEGTGIPEHVVVKRDSKVEFLEAEGELIWSERSVTINVSVAGDVWLRVHIDGKDGWIHTQEDFAAVGLPQAG